MTSLPNDLTFALNLTTGDGAFLDKDGKNECLINLNDGECKTFKQIADIIESEPEGLFCD